MTNFTFYDLFCGAGGLGYGFHRAGFKPLFAIDIRGDAIRTYNRNVSPQKSLCADIRTVNPESILRETGRPDLIAGCPPCQGFSKLNGRGREQKFDDPRNELTRLFAEWVMRIRPTAVFFENVPGITRHPVYEGFRRRLRRAYQIVLEEVIDLAEYGIAVRRKRLILIAVSKDLSIDFRPPDKTGPVPAGAILKRYERIPPGTASLPNHRHLRITKKTLERIRLIPKNGGDRRTVPDEKLPPCHRGPVGKRRFTDVLARLREDEPAPYLTSGWYDVYRGRYIHPRLDRPLTAREAAALMSFPDDFVFEGSFTSWAHQIGEAFPPEAARRFAEAIRHSLFARASAEPG